jgi:predicted aspartyl protease
MPISAPIAALLAALAATSLAATPTPAIDPALTAEAAAGTEALAPSTEAELLDAAADRYERMTVPVTIEGQGPFRFMIDTGAQATVVTRQLGARLGLPPAGRATVVGMASRVPVDLVRLDGLEFAARVIDNLAVPTLEARHVGADGILGLDSLQDLRVMIDFREETIAVDTAKALGGNTGYEIIVRARHRLGRLIITEATIDGVRTAVIVDTGAQGSIGNMALMRRLRASDREQGSTTDVNGQSLNGAVDFARSLRIKDMELSNLVIMFADSPAFEVLGLDERPALVLGMRELRVFDRVAIDFEARTVLFDMPKSAAPRPRMNFGVVPSRL